MSSCLTNVALVAAALARLPFGSASNGGAGDERPVTLAPLQISSSGSTWLVFLFNEMSLWITIEPSFTEFYRVFFLRLEIVEAGIVVLTTPDIVSFDWFLLNLTKT